MAEYTSNEKKALEPVAEALRTHHINSMPDRYGPTKLIQSPWHDLTEDRRQKWYELADISYKEWYDTIYDQGYDAGYDVGYDSGLDASRDPFS